MKDTVSDEQLAIIMEYLRKHGVPKRRIKNAVDAWYKIKGETK